MYGLKHTEPTEEELKEFDEWMKKNHGETI